MHVHMEVFKPFDHKSEHKKSLRLLSFNLEIAYIEGLEFKHVGFDY